jgi:hypothetical protein
MPFLIRSSRAGTDSFLTEVRQTVWAVNGSLPITEIRTMKQIYDKSMTRTGFTLTLLAISGYCWRIQSQPRKLFKFDSIKRISSLFGGFANNIGRT